MKDILAAERAALAHREEEVKRALAPLEEKRNELYTELAGIAHSSDLLDHLIARVEALARMPVEDAAPVVEADTHGE